ncbi:fibroblast growth factor receptor substrate 2 isoform X2 [Lepisosteus oculatus]|uniref:fibroblast growth factor receptor substrate 2 isoform X2 n=1 Tax=Lepisosteus oculatus TaxID=7918 RepID=UPI0003EA99E6|nr:PREDICTED: fibroblast growth factor receptor substrate 3 isoform X2 [Lepisosteus oculatus]
MGSCWSCLYRDTIPDTHPTKFKVTNVDDEGNELGSGIMELTQTELILHTRKRDAVRWPYLCLRRYGYDSNLFSFESGRRCQTGQGIFAFKCSRAEEIFNLLQELMQCNSINVVEEPVIITHNSHAPELELPRTPQTPSTPAYTVQGFPNGYPGYPVSADGSSHPSTRHPSLAEDHAHGFMGLEDQAHTYVNTASVEGDVRGRHCVHSLPEVRPNPYPESARGGGGGPGGHPVIHCCPLEERNPQVFLQPPSGEVKFVLGPTPAQRRLMDMEREALGKQVHMRHPHGHLTLEGVGGGGSEHEGGGGPPPLPPPHSHAAHSYHHHHLLHRHGSAAGEHEEGCQAVRLAYENINGLGGGRGGELRRGGGSGRLKLCPGSVSLSGGSSSSSSGGEGHCHSRALPHSHSLPHALPHALPAQGYSCERAGGGVGSGHRKTALLNYENLPSLPPVWEYRALQREEEQDEEDDEQDEEDYEEEEYDEYSEDPGTPNGYHQDGGGDGRDVMRNYVNTERVQPGVRRPACPPRGQHRADCHVGGGGGVFSFDFRRGGGVGRDLSQQRQLNYIQVDLDGDSECGNPQQQHQKPVPIGTSQPPRHSEFYAVIDLKKTAAMSSLQRALPRDDGTSRKTRHNSTDLPL